MKTTEVIGGCCVLLTIVAAIAIVECGAVSLWNSGGPLLRIVAVAAGTIPLLCVAAFYLLDNR